MSKPDLAEENRRLRERLGPHGLEVVEINGVGHYVNVKIKAEIERLRARVAILDRCNARIDCICRGEAMQQKDGS